MSDSHSSTVPSWSHCCLQLCAKAAASRGTITLPSHDGPSTTLPRITVRDALAIASVFDPAIDYHATASITARWRSVLDLLTCEPADHVVSNVGNRSFWEALAASADQLDLIDAPLPAQAMLDAAMRELSDPAHCHQDDAAQSMLVTVFVEPTWQAMATRQLAFFRILRGELPGETPYVPAVPCTSNADVLSLAHYWTEQLARLPTGDPAPHDRLVHACWREVLHRVTSHARRAPAHEPYRHNAELWNALLLVATQSEARDESPMPWALDVTRGDGLRNAQPVDTGATLDFPAAKTWDEAAQMQRDAFSRLRGEDVATGRLIARVPRTTVADVRQLAAYWSSGLLNAGGHHFADISYRHVVQRWLAAVAEVDRIPLDTDPSSTYARNTDFWEALMTIAIQVAVTEEAPTRWQLVKEATKKAIGDLPNTLGTALEDLVRRMLAKPLLYLGLGVGGLVAAVYLLRGSGTSEGASARASQS